MPQSRTVFAELMTHVSPRTFQTCVARYGGDYKTSRFSCWDQYLCMAFAQLTYRESLRDIEACLRAVQPRLYHVGIRARISRSTLADANETREWRIYADFAQSLIRTARDLYVNDPLAVDLANTVYALDATIIDCVCRSFRGRAIGGRTPPSSCTRSWTCAARSPPSCRFPKENRRM
jgi:hypothetical protein